MRTIGAVILASSLVVSGAYAAPLAPGKPAGVKKAQSQNDTAFIIAGVGLMGLGIGLAASGDNNPITPATTTTTTTTTTTRTSP